MLKVTLWLTSIIQVSEVVKVIYQHLQTYFTGISPHVRMNCSYKSKLSPVYACIHPNYHMLTFYSIKSVWLR